MTAAVLNQAERGYERAAELAERMRKQRNELVREALAEGWTQTEIALATGLSRGRIHQIIKVGSPS